MNNTIKNIITLLIGTGILSATIGMSFMVVDSKRVVNPFTISSTETYVNAEGNTAYVNGLPYIASLH